jgi:hypothetical protein
MKKFRVTRWYNTYIEKVVEAENEDEAREEFEEWFNEMSDGSVARELYENRIHDYDEVIKKS